MAAGGPCGEPMAGATLAGSGVNWVDVCGPPGIGKSTLCDPLWGHREIGWDGKLPPASWQPFLEEMTTLFRLIRPHWSFVPAVRMNNRSVRKMATVARMAGDPRRGAYVQTGFVQRGLGFGWRLNQMGADVNLIRQFFKLMPVSIGVAFLDASEATIVARNEARKRKPETAHEDRSFMVPLMAEPIRIAKEALHERGVPVIEIDVERQSVESARKQLVEFAAQETVDTPPGRPCGEMEI